MATLYNITKATAVADLKAGLTAQGLITTTHYETTEYLIITSPLVTGKVLKIRPGYSNWMYFWIGNAWTSGETITNEVMMGYCHCDFNKTAMWLIADTDWFAYVGEYSYDGHIVACLFYVGKTAANKEIVFGTNRTDYVSNSKMYDLSDDCEFRPISIQANESFISPSGYVYTVPFCFYNTSTKLALMNSTALDYIKGIKFTSYKGYDIKNGTGYKILNCTEYEQHGWSLSPMSMLIEYTP